MPAPAAAGCPVYVTPCGVIFSIDSMDPLEIVAEDAGRQGSPQVDSPKETT
jgi:hypothetical protein